MSNSALAGIIVAGALVVLVIIIVAAKKSSAPISQRNCGNCKRVMMPQWQKCMFCGWAPVARLEFILGPMANQTLPLTEAVTTIGSVAGNIGLAMLRVDRLKDTAATGAPLRAGDAPVKIRSD